MGQKLRKWGVVIPPTGAAREVMLSVVRTMDKMGEVYSLIDSLAYQEAFEAMMAENSKDMALDFWNQYWVCKALQEEWTHTLVGALAPVTVQTIRLWKKIGVISVHWFYEDYRQIEYWKIQATEYDLFCAVQKEPLRELVGTGFRFLPTATEGGSSLPFADFDHRKYDLMFIGIPSEYRIKILEMLSAHGVKIAIAGPYWNRVPTLYQYVVIDGWVDQVTTEKLYSASRLGLNISQSDPELERSVHQVSPRIYDLAGYGTLPITEDLPLGDDLYKELKLIRFSDCDELLQKVREVLDNGISSEIYLHNREAIQKGHLYKQRVEQIISWVEALSLS